MALTGYPIGLHARTKCFRCCSTTWNQDTRDWILSRMKGSANNIKPVCVVEADESVTMYLPNQGLTDLIQTAPGSDQIIMVRRVESIAHWMKERTRVQRSNNISKAIKERICELLMIQDLQHNPLTGLEIAELAQEMAKDAPSAVAGFYVATPIAGGQRNDAAIKLGVTNDTNPIITGNPSATWRINVTYRVIKLN